MIYDLNGKKIPTESEIKHAEDYARSLNYEAKMRDLIPFAGLFGGKELSKTQMKSARDALKAVGSSIDFDD